VRDWASLQSTAMHIADYTHDSQPVIILSTRVLALEALANRIFTGPVPFRKYLFAMLSSIIATKLDRGPSSGPK
jgi:hypothetical protein